MTKIRLNLTPPTPKLPLTNPEQITPRQREKLIIQLYREGYTEPEIGNILLTNIPTVSETIKKLTKEEREQPRVRIDGKIITPHGGRGPRPTIFEILLLDLFSRFFTRTLSSRILQISPSVAISNIRAFRAGEYEEIFTKYKETHGEDPREIFKKICMETTGKPPEKITLTDIHQHGGKLVKNTKKEIQRRRKKLITQKPDAIIQNTQKQARHHTLPQKRSYR